MSITGRFEADFQSFYQAVDRADAKLADFQSGAGRVETALNKMVDSLSGRKLLQDATISAEAVERIGGASKLTQKELEALGAKAAEAVAKMKAMGVEVPKNIEALAANARHAKEETGGLSEAFTELGKEVVAVFTVEKVIEFVSEIGKAEQALSKLGKETQIDVEELQDLTAATKSYGLSNEELAKALFNVSQGIAGGDEGIVRGLHQIGLTLDEVKDKHGKELFLDIERGLAQLDGSMRDTAAANIFGSKLGSQMAGFSKEAEGAIAKASELTKLSREEVEDLAKYADEVERLEHNVGTFVEKLKGGFATIVNQDTDALRGGLPVWKLALAHVQDYFAAMSGNAPTHALALTTAFNAQLKAQEEQENKNTAAIANQTVELTKEQQAQRFLDALRMDAAKALEPYQLRGLEALRDMGQLNQQNASAIGVGVDQFKQYTESVRQAEAATKTLTAATIENGAQIAKITNTVNEALGKRLATQTELEKQALDKQEADELLSIQKRYDAQKAALEQAHADSKENLDKLAADSADATSKVKGQFDRLRDGIGTDFDEIRTHTQAYLQDQADRALNTLIEARSTIGVTRQELEALEQKYRAAALAASASGQAAAAAGQKGVDSTTAWNQKVQDLDKQYEDLKKKQEAISYSTDITAANIDQYNPAGVNKSELIKLLEQGFSIANALSVLEAQKRGVFIDLSKWPEDARGPRVPGFEGGVQDWAGGKAWVGEHGPELLDLPAGTSVFPARRAKDAFSHGGGGGVGIYAPVYVSGVFDPSSQAIMEKVVGAAMMKSVGSGRILR